jgi:hypothetical protein
MNENTKKIIDLADVQLSSREIARVVGLTPRYVRKVLKNRDLPRLPTGAQRGCRNPAWLCGRIVDFDGYVTIPAPLDYRDGRKSGRIYEHRYVAMRKIGRPLEPQEVVDHIDGLKLHNHPDNLRIFANNGEHLSATIRGKKRNWSAKGLRNIGQRADLGANYQPVDTYRQRKREGDERLLQILLLAYEHGIDNPFLWGTLHHLEKKQIDYSSRTRIRHALDGLCHKYELTLPQLQS